MLTMLIYLKKNGIPAFVLWFLTGLPFHGIAQEQPLYFSSLGFEDGLSSNVTNSIVQDSEGFIWIGTEEGLCRYDGYKMILFKTESTPTSIPSNRISSLLLDDKILWVGTWNGLCTINTQTFAVQRINFGDINTIRTLYKDKRGRIWIGTANGLIVHEKPLNQYKFYGTHNSALSHNTIRSFYESENGDMWIGTFNKLNRFREGKFKSFDLKGDYKPLLKNNLILTIKSYSEKNNKLLWVGTETGLCLFNTQTGKIKHYNTSNTNLSNEIIKCIYKDKNKLWIGTDFGLNILDPLTYAVSSYYHNPIVNHSISNNVVWDIFKDANNILWFITSNGISLLNSTPNSYKIKETFYSVNNHKAGNQIRDILASPDGSVWLATIHGVIHETAGSQRKTFTTTGPVNERLLLDNVYALERDRYGRIWIGTAGGINIWDEKRKKMHSISANKNNGLSSNYINGFAKQSDGSFWVSAWEGGLYKIIGNIETPSELKFKLANIDGSGKPITIGNDLYYGTQNDLWRIDPNTFATEAIEKVHKAINTQTISFLKNDKDGNIWLGNEEGLIRYNPKTNQSKNYPIKTGGNTVLLSIEVDLYGNIWTSTPNSVIKIDVTNNKTISMPLSPNSSIKSFYRYCSTISPEGLIYFGGDNGYIEIDPKSTGNSIEEPPIFISGLYINNQAIIPSEKSKILHQDIAFTKHLKLNYSANSLTFDFSTLDFWLPHKNHYKYQLVNYDENWNYTSANKNFAVYSNLPPGEYHLQVTGTNHSGLSSKSTASLAITIKPPLLLSTPFLFIYFIMLAGISYAVFRIYSYRRKINNELKIAKLEKIHSEQLLQAKQQFFTNISHEFRTPLSLIIPSIQQVLKTGKMDKMSQRMLMLAGKNSQRLLKLVNQILDFRKMENTSLQLLKSPVEFISFCHEVFNTFLNMANRNQINYHFHSDTEELYLYIDTEKFESILINLLSNAFKYTSVNGKIEFSVSLNKETEHVEVSITDSGDGISLEDQEMIFNRFYQSNENKKLQTGSGIGLTISLEYAKLHKGNIKVYSEPKKGSCFSVEFPIEKAPALQANQPLKYSFSLPQTESKTQSVKLQDVNTLKLLLIDDNEDILDYMELNLGNKYRIQRAMNGSQGLDMAIQDKPDMIISDVMMPVMDGKILCQHLKTNPQTAHIPVILLTAQSLDSQKTEGLNTGADLYITKPFDTDYLISCIESLFRREKQLYQYIKKELLINPDNEISQENNQDEIFIKKVMNIIENNLNNPLLSVEMISTEIGLSSTHLYRRLKTITNQSTKDIIKNYRLQKAAQMIQNKEGNITEVMYSIGFSSLSSFSKSFKSLHGLSPSEYAKKKTPIKNELTS